MCTDTYDVCTVITITILYLLRFAWLHFSTWCWLHLFITQLFLRCFSIFFILQLHLNPLHAVMQLRPSLKHLSSAGSKKSNNITGDAEGTIKSEESSGKKAVGTSKKQVCLLVLLLCNFFPFWFIVCRLFMMHFPLKG